MKNQITKRLRKLLAWELLPVRETCEAMGIDWGNFARMHMFNYIQARDDIDKKMWFNLALQVIDEELDTPSIEIIEDYE